MSFDVAPREVVALVGESGAGKSATAMAVVGLLPEYAQVSGSVRLQGDELIGLDDQRMSRIRGRVVGTVFQDPMSALTPVYPVGQQIAEALRVHQRGIGRAAAATRAVELQAKLSGVGPLSQPSRLRPAPTALADKRQPAQPECEPAARSGSASDAALPVDD